MATPDKQSDRLKRARQIAKRQAGAFQRQRNPARFTPLLRRLNSQGINAPYALSGKEASVVADALALARDYQVIDEERRALRARISHAIEALREPWTLARRAELSPAKLAKLKHISLDRRLRMMANRLLLRPDKTRVGHLYPAENIKSDWYALTRDGTDPERFGLRREGCRKHRAKPHLSCAKCPDPFQPFTVSGGKAISVLARTYLFFKGNTKPGDALQALRFQKARVACVKYLERRGVKGLPAIRER
jgi:hypothetical protein